MIDKSKQNKELIMKYRKAVDDFNNYIKNIYSQVYLDEELYGYLISLKEYNSFINFINYNNYKKNEIELNDFNKNFQINIKPIEFNTSEYLLNMIFNNNEYIIISKDLFKIICKDRKENEGSIKYKKYSSFLELYMEDKKSITFNFSNKGKNILDKKSYYFFTSSIDEFNIIYKDIKIVYDFEKQFIDELNNRNNISNQRTEYKYLVSKKLFDKWKKYSNYEQIKKYLNQNMTKHDIINNLIYYKEKNHYEKLNKINLISFKYKIDVENFLKNDSLVIINCGLSFINNFISHYDIVKYIANNQKIHLILDDEELIFTSNDNILSEEKLNHHNSMNEENNKNFMHLKQIINIFFFQKYISEKINSFNEGTNFEENNPIYLINKKIIKKYKNILDFRKIHDILNNEITNSINYQNINLKFKDILK